LHRNLLVARFRYLEWVDRFVSDRVDDGLIETDHQSGTTAVSLLATQPDTAELCRPVGCIVGNGNFMCSDIDRIDTVGCE